MLRSFIFLSLIFSLTAAQAQTDILFVIDSSGSMKQMIDGKSQMDSAKEALISALTDVPEGTNVGIRAYAHRVAQSDKAGSCKDTELIVPVEPISKESIQMKVSALTPKGYTPIAFSLEQTPDDFKASRESEKVIILLSDGEETCGGDPVGVLNRLKGEGFKVVVHTIGFNVDNKTRAQLKDIAKAGSGEYFDAHNARALNVALKDATKKSFIIDKKKSTYGTEIRGGDSFENAIPIQLDVEYKLDHHQRKAFYDYFLIQGKRGQEIEVTVKTLEKGIELDPKERITDSPYAGVKINSPSREEIGHKELIAKKFDNQTAKAQVKNDGPHYVLIGSEYEDMNKDSVTFTVKITSKGDADTETDAGETADSALKIESKRYKGNYLGGDDKEDEFIFDAKTGEKYFVGVIPSDDLTIPVQITVFDDYKQSLVSATSKAGEGVKTDTFTIPADGTYSVEVKNSYSNDKIASYTLDLKKVEELPKENAPIAGSENITQPPQE